MVFKSLIFAFRMEGQEELNLDVLVFKKHMLFSVSPNNADILLNLARVLFNLQYLDDAIVLTRRSLEVQPPDQNAWAQHFQLGEILKAYCHYQEVRIALSTLPRRLCFTKNLLLEPIKLKFLCIYTNNKI